MPLITGDSGDQALVGRLSRDYGIEAIIHFAASAVVPESMRDPLAYYRDNTVIIRALVRFAVNNGVRCFIITSTAAIYGRSGRDSGDGKLTVAADLALGCLEADARSHAPRRRPRLRFRLCDPALFQSSPVPTRTAAAGNPARLPSPSIKIAVERADLRPSAGFAPTDAGRSLSVAAICRINLSGAPLVC